MANSSIDYNKIITCQFESVTAKSLFYEISIILSALIRHAIIIPMNKLENIVSLCKRRGFIFPGSEIYGGFAGTWDFGPLGVALKQKLMSAWWDFFVTQHDNVYGVDAAILMNPKTWQASGVSAPTKSPTTSANPSLPRNSLPPTPNAPSAARSTGGQFASST